MDERRRAVEEGGQEWSITIVIRQDISPLIAGQKVEGKRERARAMEREN
jgi:hypothetical protein